VRRFILFHGKRHPSTMAAAEVNQGGRCCRGMRRRCFTTIWLPTALERSCRRRRGSGDDNGFPATWRCREEGSGKELFRHHPDETVVRVRCARRRPVDSI